MNQNILSLFNRLSVNLLSLQNRINILENENVNQNGGARKGERESLADLPVHNGMKKSQDIQDTLDDTILRVDFVENSNRELKQSLQTIISDQNQIKQRDKEMIDAIKLVRDNQKKIDGIESKTRKIDILESQVKKIDALERDSNQDKARVDKLLERNQEEISSFDDRILSIELEVEKRLSSGVDLASRMEDIDTQVQSIQSMQSILEKLSSEVKCNVEAHTSSHTHLSSRIQEINDEMQSRLNTMDTTIKDMKEDKEAKEAKNEDNANNAKTGVHVSTDLQSCIQNLKDEMQSRLQKLDEDLLANTQKVHDESLSFVTSLKKIESDTQAKIIEISKMIHDLNDKVRKTESPKTKPSRESKSTPPPFPPPSLDLSEAKDENLTNKSNTTDTPNDDKDSPATNVKSIGMMLAEIEAHHDLTSKEGSTSKETTTDAVSSTQVSQEGEGEGETNTLPKKVRRKEIKKKW